MLDPEGMIDLNTEELTTYLAQRTLAPQHLTPLTDFLIAWADHLMPTHPPQAVRLYLCLLRCYEGMNSSSHLCSLERFRQAEKINRPLRRDPQDGPP